jgi:alkanesulfonate monooxygenase SsuD/methylene tetrahydromethanopterin reductase-like flavin-dependent oxidoreductase (luciferase family)
VKIGFMMPIGENTDTNTVPSYQEIRERALKAEAAGLDSIWLPDHLIYRFPEQPERGIHEAMTIWAGLAEATSTIELGTLVLCVPFRNPAVLAKMAVEIDEISNGRIILGLGAGWHQPEFDAFGISFDKKVERFEEALEIIVPLIRDNKVDFTGKHYSAPNSAINPEAKRQIPILIASKGPRMLDLTAKWADQWNLAWYGRYSAFARDRELMYGALDARGRDRSSMKITTGITVNFPDLKDIGEAARNTDKVLSGTVEEIADALVEYAENGVDQVIIAAAPLDIDRLAQIRSIVNERTGATAVR